VGTVTFDQFVPFQSRTLPNSPTAKPRVAECMETAYRGLGIGLFLFSQAAPFQRRRMLS
jgi:hypothetical protein